MNEAIEMQIIREIYADALETVERTKERQKEFTERGDAWSSAIYGDKVAERERAANRIRSVCIRHGFDPAKDYEGK